MKSYIQGMITGGVMVFATIVFMGQHTLEEIKNNKEKWQEVSDNIALSKKLTAMGINPRSEIGTYQLSSAGGRALLLNTTNGVIWSWHKDTHEDDGYWHQQITK